MRKPRGKRLCAHLTVNSCSSGYCWRVGRREDLLLCEACHRTFAEGGCVRVDAIIGFVAEPASHYKNPPASASYVLEQRQYPKPSALAIEAHSIAMESSRLAAKVAMPWPGHDWRLSGESRSWRQLKRRIDRHPDKAGPVLQSAAEKLEWVRQRLAWTRQTIRGFQNLVRRAERLLRLALAEPGQAILYRRRAYRKLKRELDQIARLLFALTVPLSHLGDYQARGTAAFEALAYLFGGRLTDAQLVAVIARTQSSLGAEAVQAYLSCECLICKAARDLRVLTPSQEAETLSSCSCGLCRGVWRGLELMPSESLVGHPLLNLRMRNAN